MQTAYLEAVVNRRHRVLGRELHDFCLYDALFLTVAENPLWLGDREPTVTDLEAAVLICSLPPERILHAEVTPRHWPGRVARWLWQYKCAKLDLEAFKLELQAELAAWSDYIADYDARPKLWESTGGGRSMKAPWILSLACYIEMHSNMREREIMTAPIGLMFWKAQTIAERRGENVADMMTEEEIAIGAEQRQAMAESGESFPEDDEPEEGSEE